MISLKASRFVHLLFAFSIVLAASACGDSSITADPDASQPDARESDAFAALDAAAEPEDAARASDAGVDAGDHCAPFAGCGMCTNEPGCGFCPSNGACMSGRASGPTVTGACVWGWTYLPERCTTSSDPCLLIGSSCGTCTARSGCGWCGPANRCMTGTATGPSSTTCTTDWSFGSGMCE